MFLFLVHVLTFPYFLNSAIVKVPLPFKRQEMPLTLESSRMYLQSANLIYHGAGDLLCHLFYDLPWCHHGKTSEVLRF